MAAQGMQTVDAKGKTSVEHALQIDFAADQPWHHYPAVTALSDDDRGKIVALLAERAGWFQPDFAAAYRALEGNPHIDLARVRGAKCLEAAWGAGARVRPPAADTVTFTTTGSAAVVVRGKGDELYDVDRGDFEKITDEERRMCAGMMLAYLYQPRLVVVRTPEGAWEALP